MPPSSVRSDSTDLCSRDLSANALSTDSVTACVTRQRRKLQFLPVISEDNTLLPSRAPDFAFNSSKVAIEVYHNRVFWFARSNRTGVVERDEYVVSHFQGIQYNQVFVVGQGPKVIHEETFGAFTSATQDPVTKEIRMRASIPSGGYFEYGMILDRSVLPEKVAMKFTNYIKDVNYAGFNRSAIDSVSLPIVAVIKAPHTTATSRMNCTKLSNIYGLPSGNCVSQSTNVTVTADVATDIYGTPQVSLIFDQISQKLRIYQVWPLQSTLFIDGLPAGMFGFRSFYSFYYPYGLQEYYEVQATAFSH